MEKIAPRNHLLSLRTIYGSLLARYKENQRRESGALYNRAFECAIDWLASALGAAQDFRFPARETGGWWWTSRFRFESLMGWFEEESTMWCDRLIKPGMTVIDVGAHIGLYTRRFAKLVGPTGRVIAFEPNPENFAILRRNLRRAGNVEIHHLCVADRDARFTLHISPGHSNHSLLPGYTASSGEVEVSGVSLDSFLSSRGMERVDFVKCDVEGAEPLVVAGMSELLSRSNRPAVLMEYNPAALACGDSKPEDLLAQLKRFDYEVQAIASDGNLLCLPAC